MNVDLLDREYRPELISRRGEMIAWLGCSIVAAAWVILAAFDQGVNLLIFIVFILLFLVAASISLGNWMDRNTCLNLGPEGVAYHNGLRRVSLKWTDIQEVRVLPAPWGRKVQVLGDKVYFGFSTFGEVKANDRILGQTGFADGDTILQQIILNADLKNFQPAEAGLPEKSYYYARK